MANLAPAPCLVQCKLFVNGLSAFVYQRAWCYHTRKAQSAKQALRLQVPFIAHKQLGDSYKWLLYGDDDTVWFMDGVLRFLEDLDPDMPYFISGLSTTLLLGPLIKALAKSNTPAEQAQQWIWHVILYCVDQ